jgi:hypothetical protein
MVRRALTAISIVVLAASTEACFTGRYLYLEDEARPTQELNATEDGQDGGVASSDDAAIDTTTPVDGSTVVTDAASDATTKTDAAPPGPGPGPAPNPNCAAGAIAEIEPNGTVDQARALAVGTTCGGLTLGDTDWFMMDMGQQGQLRVNFAADGDARLLIQSAGGGLALATGSGGSFNFATQGRWNLRVVSDTGRIQSYTLVRPAP